ncbi:hypothetical protein [Nocardioides sp. GXZ039]|uniref:hypothetical protein n=1 Tax=Nocardioides sp. GXZ039 TaxID=3136018 RepID=UPI0030F3A042
MASQPQRLYLHIGMQKTGTSYLQDAMLRSRERLADAGVDLVPPTKRECFELMVVVRDRYEARRDPASDQAILDRFTRELDQATGGRAVFSQESLAGAGPAQITRLLELCGDREVHVVVTARDLARQLSSSWQQELKAGSTVDLPSYLRQLRRAQRAGRGGHPWIHLDPPQVLARWAEALPADRLHLVTVPPSGSPTTVLLERFAHTIGFDPDLLEPEDSPSNSSLGVVQAEVLRRVNERLPEEVHRRYIYADVVKRGFSAGVLVKQQPRRIRVPTRLRPWCEEVSEAQIVALGASGYQIRGRLDDLRCPDSAFTDEDLAVSEEEIAEATLAAVSTMLTQRGTELAKRRSGRIEVAADDEPEPRTVGLAGRLRRRIGR